MALILQRLFYPFLLGLYFVLFVFSENLGQAYLDQTFRSIGAVLLFTILLVLLFAKLFKSVDKGGFVSALILTLIFIHAGIYNFLFPRIGISLIMLLVIEIITLIAIATATLRSLRDWPKLNKTLNIIVGVLLLMTSYRIASYGMTDAGIVFEPEVSQTSSNIDEYTVPEVLPNIFHILVDGYARADTLQKYFNYDNSDFIDFLKETGFQVGDQSLANYSFTYLATNAVLNSDYITTESGFATGNTASRSKYLSNRLFNSRAGNVLGRIGYDIITLQSVGQYVRTAGAQNLTPDSRWIRLNEFDVAVLDTTLLPRIFSRFFSGVASQRRMNEFVIDQVARLSSAQEPVFVIAHIMSPHTPFLYDREGNTPDISKFDFGKPEHLAANVQAYGDQVHYLNQLLKTMITEILANSRTPPIIVLQGDHGLRITTFTNQVENRNSNLEDACLEEVLPILNAMYLPGPDGVNAFYNSISPVNTFRLIIDTYFGGNLGFLPDRSFYAVKSEASKAQEFIEVTGSQQTCSAKWTERFEDILTAN